jgi:hypothetical protein
MRMSEHWLRRARETAVREARSQPHTGVLFEGWDLVEGVKRTPEELNETIVREFGPPREAWEDRRTP